MGILSWLFFLVIAAGWSGIRVQVQDINHGYKGEEQELHVLILKT
jgi:hypothetical protein